MPRHLLLAGAETCLAVKAPAITISAMASVNGFEDFRPPVAAKWAEHVFDPALFGFFRLDSIGSFVSWSKIRDGDLGASIKVEEKGEAYWLNQFADIHYNIRMAQSELDILQRELNEALLIYDPNPRKAFRENVTRQNISAHLRLHQVGSPFCRPLFG